MAVVIITPDAVVRVSFVITKLYNIQPYLCLRNIVLIGHADNYLIVSTLWLMASSLEQQAWVSILDGAQRLFEMYTNRERCIFNLEKLKHH